MAGLQKEKKYPEAVAERTKEQKAGWSAPETNASGLPQIKKIKLWETKQKFVLIATENLR